MLTCSFVEAFTNGKWVSVELVRWVTESKRPFNIVADQGFNSLMKTGRPGYYLPHPTTVACDTKTVFAKTRTRVADLLQVSPHYPTW